SPILHWWGHCWRRFWGHCAFHRRRELMAERPAHLSPLTYRSVRRSPVRQAGAQESRPSLQAPLPPRGPLASRATIATVSDVALTTARSAESGRVVRLVRWQPPSWHPRPVKRLRVPATSPGFGLADHLRHGSTPPSHHPLRPGLAPAALGLV